MNYKKILFSILYSFIFLISWPAIPLRALQPSAGPLGDMDQMPSEAEFLEMQKQMEDEINKYVSTLSAEEQVRFHELVEEETRKMEAMDEDQFNAYVQEMLDEIEKTQQEIAPEVPVAVEEKPTVTPVKPAAPVVVPEAPLDETEKALKIINNVITNTESFLRKAQRIPELPGKIDQWVAKDKVSQWQVDLTWETLQSKINELDQKLIHLKERDPNTKKYRYIVHLLKKESAFNNLVKLRESLNESEPLIEIPEFGLGKVSKESRAAIQKVLSSFAEAIYTLDLPEELDKIFAEFEPRAKELRDEEEGARKKALEESKKGIKESPRKEIGSKETTRSSSTEKGGGSYYDDAYRYPGGASTDYSRDAYDYDRKYDRSDSTETEGKTSKTESADKTAEKNGKKKEEEEKHSKEFVKTLELIEQALVSIEEVFVTNGYDNVKDYISSVVRPRTEEPTKKKDPNGRKSAALELRNAATSLRKAKRKMNNLSTKEKQEVVLKVRNDPDFTEIVGSMKSVSITDDSSEELRALKELSNAITSFFS